MASFDDDADPANGSQDEFDNENEDEEMEDADQDAEADQDDDQGGDEDQDEEEDQDDNDNDEDEDEDQPDQDSPSRRASQHPRRSPERDRERPPTNGPSVVLTSPSPRRSPNTASTTTSFIPPTRPEALIAQAYDIVPTIAAPQGTSINAVAATPDMRYVFSGGSDGYVRMFNWVETANGKVPLTVAQKHPFVDSVMKAGSLLTYWENEEPVLDDTPQKGAAENEGKWSSPVYSLAVQHQALWLLSGLESGGINLQTCRHQAGTTITTLKEHTSAVSVLSLSQDETTVLSGSWDKAIHDWDLQTGKIKRSFRGSGSQISAIEPRPLSDVSVPEVSDSLAEPLNGTFSSNNADKPLPNGIMSNGVDRRGSKGGGEEDAAGSPSGSLFADDHGSLFGEDTTAGGGAGATFGDEEDDLTRALANGLQEGAEQDAPAEQDTDMGGMGDGGPVQPPERVNTPARNKGASMPNGQAELHADGESQPVEPPVSHENVAAPLSNGLPHGEEPLTAPPTTEGTSSTDIPTQSQSTFLSASIDGTLRIWDRRTANSVATIAPQPGTPPWCTGACWSPDGSFFYAGRRNCTVDEYDVRKLGGDGGFGSVGKPSRIFRFQAGSGPVYAVRGMPNGRHLVW